MSRSRAAGRGIRPSVVAAAIPLVCGMAEAAKPARAAGAEPKPPPLARWGAEALGQIEKDLRVRGTDLYAEFRKPDGERGNRPYGRYSFVWPAGFQLRALAAAARVQPKTYRQRLVRFADALQQYWRAEDGLGGYMVLTSRSERFYDDNAWLLIGLIETWRATGQKRFLDRAKRVVPLLLAGEKKTARAGIRQREGRQGGAFTCTTAPAAVGVLELYRITKDAAYLRMGERWYAWLTDPNVGVQDPKTGLYHQGARWNGARWEVKLGYRAYQSALPMQAALLLHRIKAGPDGKAYLREAQRIAQAAVAKWVKPDGAFGETAQWGGSDLVDALLDLYDVDRNPRWRRVVCSVLRYVHDRTRDPNGRYGEYWSVDRRRRPLEECKLLYMAPVARAYWRAARYPQEQGRHEGRPGGGLPATAPSTRPAEAQVRPPELGAEVTWEWARRDNARVSGQAAPGQVLLATRRPVRATLTTAVDGAIRCAGGTVRGRIGRAGRSSPGDRRQYLTVSSPLKKSSWLRAGLPPARLRRENSTNRLDSPASSLLGAQRNAALSPTEHFFNGLLGEERRPCARIGSGANGLSTGGLLLKRESESSR